jgi:hypothetical protein
MVVERNVVLALQWCGGGFAVVALRWWLCGGGFAAV